MNSNNALITKLNKKIDYYLKQEQYDKADEACRSLCRIQGLTPADQMPEDFLCQLKRKEHKTMNIKKHSRRISGIAAVAAISVLLIGTTVSAAVIYNKDIHLSTKGLLSEEDFQASYTSREGETTVINLPEMSQEDIITSISEEKGTDSTPWLSKKIWDETSEIWDSDDAVNWTKGWQTVRVTQYKYGDYFTAVDDAGFDRLFRTNYTGNAFYYEKEHLPDASDAATSLGSITDYRITGEFSYGKGLFSIAQSKNRTDKAKEVSATPAIAVTATDKTGNVREYLNAAGISFRLSDDTESGYVRTTTMFTGDNYDTVLQFTGMSEEEIHTVLDNIQG